MAVRCGDSSAGKRRMLLVSDCGAVAVDSRKMKIDIQDYIAFIRHHEHLFEFYISMDVIGDGEKSYRNWEYMLAEGLTPVPVYHHGTDNWFLEEYLRRTDYVAISLGKKDKRRLSVPKRLKMLEEIWQGYLLDSIGYKKARVHGLGITAPELVAAFPWDSVDSASWVYEGGKYAKILVPKKVGSNYAYDQPAMRISVATRSSHRRDHIDNLLTSQQHQVEEYVESRGFTLGKGDEGDSDYEQGLRNSEPLRNLLNATFYTRMGLALRTRVFIAGGFTTIVDIEVERQMQHAVFALGSDYCRMVSFADYSEIDPVLDLKRKELGDDKTSDH